MAYFSLELLKQKQLFATYFTPSLLDVKLINKMSCKQSPGLTALMTTQLIITHTHFVVVKTQYTIHGELSKVKIILKIKSTMAFINLLHKFSHVRA